MNVSDHYFVSAEGVLGLRTNVEKLKWSWGINMPERSATDFEACAVKLRLVVGDDVAPHPDRSVGEASFGKFHYYGGLPNADSVYYERTFLGRSDLKMRIDGVAAGELVMHVNTAYFKYITHRFMNLHSVGYILTDLAALQLLRAGYAPLHCSGFASGDSTVLVLAAPNMGKTLTAMMACMEHGASFLGEDLAITDGERLFSVPWTSTFRYYGRVDERRSSRVMNRLTQVMPPLELLATNQSQSIENYVPKERILSSSRVSHVVLLERGVEQVASCDIDEAIRKAITLNRYEFNYMKAPALVAYAYFNPLVDLDAAMEKERELIGRVIRQANDVVAVSTDDATRYAKMIVDHLVSA